MKITIELQDKNIHNALERPHSRYWTNECYWDPSTCTGNVIDRLEDNEPKIFLNSESIGKAFDVMYKEYPMCFARFMAGEIDGVDGDTLLQLMAFGERKYV